MEKDKQYLIDLCFEMVLSVKNNNKYWELKSNDEVAEWVRKQYKGCGFNVEGPIGMSWGVLKE